ncbi:MAG TPA: hypothetical protein VFC44_07510, partial [Candidatus Saccharimonadales bacterium]|nr:hypothetical protein [Candidatus Saccharimonadales bacterium]
MKRLLSSFDGSATFTCRIEARPASQPARRKVERRRRFSFGNERLLLLQRQHHEHKPLETF